MTSERWQEIIGHVKDNFELINHVTQDLDEDAGPGTIEILEFRTPVGQMKLEWTTQPLIIDKRTIGSKRIGGDVTVEYKYSDTEQVHKFKAFKFDEAQEAWVELAMDKGNMFF
ncbi:MAG: hypothetical protein HUU49_00520 [Candidatus Buchananbacteria bacterium]|nr:hypothetical protein [Candidatus Buchananbacteria bacterium]